MQYFLQYLSMGSDLCNSDLLHEIRHHRKTTYESILPILKKYNFPQGSFRFMQLLNCRKLIADFQDIINKGWHSLDYLSLLSRLSKKEQKLYYAKIIQPLRLGYNDQKLIFEMLWDIRQIKRRKWKQICNHARAFTSADAYKKELFAIRYPTFGREGRQWF